MLHITFALIRPKVAGSCNVLDMNSSFWPILCFLEKTTKTQSDAENEVNLSSKLIGGIYDLSKIVHITFGLKRRQVAGSYDSFGCRLSLPYFVFSFGCPTSSDS